MDLFSILGVPPVFTDVIKDLNKQFVKATREISLEINSREKFPLTDKTPVL